MPTLGSHNLRNNLFVAPMAGVTDRPFRQLCKRLGAGYAVSEMVASNAQLWKSEKTMRRANHAGEVEPIAVQIAGADPAMMAEAARYNVANGAQIIDINMGCPAKKVCNVAAGSALLQNEPLVQRIVEAVVGAVGVGPDAVPVTLKIRTGWNRENRNALNVARLAQDAGISMLTVHGRTRADLYHGDAEYETIAAVKAAVRIPVVANGDITSPEKARHVLAVTGADAIMIGRAAQGRPWLFREIEHFLQTGELLPPPRIDEIQQVMNEHLEDHYEFYGEFTGVRTARKHIGWYTRGLSGANVFRHRMNTLDTSREQLLAVNEFFDAQKAISDRLVYVDETVGNSGPDNKGEDHTDRLAA
ncbi:tRNA dihydrouridine synthase DusB [Paraburkholderia kirstenboschensis]|uniref:tRNA-dihydrouridine synthase B n=1 Tax=Paraburkholderia kirstenboschensis TaxID=1245436 RepID=A0ABZ0ELL7_9BURK|nr:tRNA dihydrouridine synthase DusB [Paraburkholderia kirstenboschensis]WOD17495.1 tRNA dihydrouridine synthase DusB [Paraburkholderia kirstenboschensis]CAD6507150.1 tRNA-dihydrouridine synthase B [Paraburkholderia kirstenboschensis]